MPPAAVPSTVYDMPWTGRFLLADRVAWDSRSNRWIELPEGDPRDRGLQQHLVVLSESSLAWLSPPQDRAPASLSVLDLAEKRWCKQTLAGEIFDGRDNHRSRFTEIHALDGGLLVLGRSDSELPPHCPSGASCAEVVLPPPEVVSRGAMLSW